MVAETVASRAKPTVIVVKTRQQLAVATFDELRAAEGTLAAADAYVERSRSLPTIVDRWFAENTFHAGEFREVAKLVDLKEKRGVTISLGLPALNEEKTIGLVIRRIKAALMDRVPLLDQVVVIDSDSTDRTREIAAELGVPVVRHSEILPETGTYRGKGEALWKSLHVLDGDIVAWVDTDIRNIQPRFVHGLIGPLLREPRIQYVKAFYRRPIREGGTLLAEGGGRVTELMARPLINLFFPELSGMIQPLSGEYAGRRALLESVPFFTGYGVEIGLLIDILEAAGLSAIGQVDLERRDPSQPAARQPVADELHHPPGRHQQARGAAPDRAADRGRPRDEGDRAGEGPIQPGGARGRRRGAAADADHPRLPGAAEGAEALMRVLVAPDSFGGALDSVGVAEAIATGWRRARPDDVVVDGSDGRRRRGDAGRRGRRARGAGRAPFSPGPRPARPRGAGGLAAARRGQDGVHRDGRRLRAGAADRRGADAGCPRGSPRRAAPGSCCSPRWTRA